MLQLHCLLGYLTTLFYTSQLHNFRSCDIVLVLGDEMKRQIPKTHQALEWVGKGLTAAQAARKMEISESSVYAALKKTRAKEVGCCPTCGHKIRN